MLTSAPYVNIGLAFFLILMLLVGYMIMLFSTWQKRVNKGKSDPCGTVHITIGDGGNREGLAQKYVITTKFLKF